jgi:NTP pyrophosphatase (non-canonical NTP hydrolase)
MQFNEYQAFFVAHQANYQIEERDRLAVIALGLAGETGEIIEHIKKYIRDGNIDLRLLKKELGDGLAYLALLSAYFDLSLDDVATTSIEKNEKRRDDGTLHGY